LIFSFPETDGDDVNCFSLQCPRFAYTSRESNERVQYFGIWRRVCANIALERAVCTFRWALAIFIHFDWHTEMAAPLTLFLTSVKRWHCRLRLYHYSYGNAC